MLLYRFCNPDDPDVVSSNDLALKKLVTTMQVGLPVRTAEVRSEASPSPSIVDSDVDEPIPLEDAASDEVARGPESHGTSVIGAG